MAGLKEIKRRLTSVQNTKKITYAMKLVSAAKLKKAQDAVARTREYTDLLKNSVVDLLAEQQGDESFSHPLLAGNSDKKENKNIKVLVVGGARGLCGGYNTNVNKRLEAFLKEKSGFNCSITILGKKPAEYCRRVRRDYDKAYEELTENIAQWPLEQVCRDLEAEFLKGNFSELYVIFTRFKSAMSQTVVAEKILPIDPSSLKSSENNNSAGTSGDLSKGSVKAEPSPAIVFAGILPKIFRASVRQACLDAKASEHGSRMTAMDAATRNAGEIIKKLTRQHNKLRQSVITAQLLDIIGGANAVD